MILRLFWLIIFNIITRNYCLNKTTLILVVAFLLSVSIYMYMWQGQQNTQFRTNQNIGSTAIKQQACFTLVILLAEFASSVWDPYTQGYIQKVEMVQRLATPYVTNRHRNTSSVSDMLQGLNWRTLQDRRKDARLCMLYMTDRELVVIRKGRMLIPSHSRTLKTISCRTDRRKMSGTGMPYHQTYQKWTHSVPSRPRCQPCKELEDVLLLACKYEDFNNPNDDSSV